MPIDFQFDPDRTVLGTVFTHAGEAVFALSLLDRMNHMLVIGKTGMGKTKLLKNLILQDIHTGRGVGVIDPHGDLQNELLNEYPAWRARDLVYLNPNDNDRVVTCNVLADVPPERIAATTSEIVAGLKANWPDSWGPRMERILYYALAAMIEAENTSLLGLPKFLKDQRYRDHILEQVKDRFMLPPIRQGRACKVNVEHIPNAVPALTGRATALIELKEWDKARSDINFRG